MKLQVTQYRTTHDRQVIMKSSDKKWSTGGIDDNPLQYSFPESPMDNMKSQKDMISEDEPSRSEGVHYATGEE